jgi:general secretion pathway protein H
VRPSLTAPHPPTSRVPHPPTSRVPPSPRARGEGWDEGPFCPAPGFTLVELLVVLTIIALAMAAVPAIVAGLPSIRLRTAADDMVATLRELHQQAIRRAETTELILDPAAGTYRISTDPAPRRLPPIVAELGFKTTAVTPSRGNTSIRFFADGSATGGTVLFKNGERIAAIKVDWLTGRVRRDE